MEAIKEKAKKAAEEQLGTMAPPVLKPFMACCGPVKTMEMSTKCLAVYGFGENVSWVS